MAEAFAAARPLLTSGYEVGARMAFKYAYKRLVNEAQTFNRPLRWSVSVGWDAGRHQLTVQDVVNAGLLEPPNQHLALPDETGSMVAKPEGLQKLQQVVAQLEDPNERRRSN